MLKKRTEHEQKDTFIAATGRIAPNDSAPTYQRGYFVHNVDGGNCHYLLCVPLHGTRTFQNTGTAMKNTKKITVRQHYKYDCGAACLVSAAAFYGIRASLAHTRLLCGCTPEGISIQGILDGASKLGLEAKGYRSPERNTAPLEGISSPVIAHIKDKDDFYHFIVIYRTGAKKMKIMDPAKGEMAEISTKEFIKGWTGYVIIITPGTCTPDSDSGEISVRAGLWSLAKNNLKELILSFAGSMVCTAAGISTTFLLQQTIDRIIPTGEMPAVVMLAILLFLLTFASLYVGYRASGYIIRSSLKIEAALAGRYMEKLFRLPSGFFNNYRAGDISSRIEDIHQIRSFITNGTIGILSSAITVTGAIAVMFFYDSRLSLIIAMTIPVYYALYRISGHLNRKYSRQIASANAAFESDLLEGISTAVEARHCGAYSLAAGKMERSYVALAQTTNRSADAVNIFTASVQGISRILLCIIMTIGSALILGGEMTIGELVGFYSLCSFFTVPLDDLIGTGEMISRTSVACRRVFEILSLPDETTLQDAISPTGIHGAIEVHDIHFRFPGREKLLDGTTFTIPEGKITMIKGDSGCGKSTLAGLLLKDFLPESGYISYGGINIRQIDTAQWRQMIGYVPQKPIVFNTSILENITLGEENPNLERVLGICASLNMLPMVEKLPQGLLTGAGSGGCNLSGGECQKICIARALYRDPMIYILDEATSALDPESERYVLEAVGQLREIGKTIIFISHRAENNIIADNVVDIGRIG